jgi:N-acetyl sugar amidotransferase
VVKKASMVFSPGLVLSQDDPAYRRCSLSVMDNIADPDIRFDENGVCNYHEAYRKAEAEHVLPGAQGWERLTAIADRIRAEGAGQPYDCIMGVSGGVDSTYVALVARKLGLKPLAVHFDNGWNSELSVRNIEEIITRSGFDLYTYVIDWSEFRDLQLAYLKASVVDIEAITDHAITCTLFRMAGERNIKYILSGTNVQTEQTMPRTWIYPKADHVNIRAIHKAYGTRPLKSYPMMDARFKRYYYEVKGIRGVSVLNYVDYDKREVKKVISSELGWRDYGGKHFESIWTRFYQGYILPQKFHIDKRKPHLSDLIFGGQLTREEALQELEKPIYDPALFREDYDFVLKKLGLSNDEFQELMRIPPKSHYAFDHERPLEERYPILSPIKKIYRAIFPFSKA